MQHMILVRGGFVQDMNLQGPRTQDLIFCMCADCMYSTWHLQCKTEERQPGSLFKQHLTSILFVHSIPQILAAMHFWSFLKFSPILMFWEPRPRPKRCATPQNMPNICKHVLDVCNMYKHDLFIHVNECDVAHSWFPTLFSVHLLQARSANAAGGCANSSRRCHARTKGEDFFDGFIWICTFCGVGFALFSPRCQQYSGIFSLGVSLWNQTSCEPYFFHSEKLWFVVVSWGFL